MYPYFYALLSVIIVSFVSLVGLALVWVRIHRLQHLIIYLVAVSAWAFFGDVFFHLVPEMIEENWSRSFWMSVFVLSGLIFGLFVEKILRRRHCHLHDGHHDHSHHVAHMSIAWDIMHNLIDGLVIWSSYLLGIEIGIATTLAIILHEIPQELWDFGVLVHGGYSVHKALRVNFLTALTAVLGCVIALIGSQYLTELPHILTPFAAWMFLYIAGSDLIPELHKQEKLSESLIQILMFVVGAGLMMSLTFVEISPH